MGRIEAERIFIELDTPEWKIDGDFRGKDIISVEQLSNESVQKVLETADVLERMDPREVKQILADKSVAVLFYQPSTRTYISFMKSALKLGAATVGSPDMVSYSSAYKGETIEDTMMTIAAMEFDAVCMRHPDDDAALVAAKATTMPIISGGSGKLEHPTQALLDVRTILKEAGGRRLNELKVAYVGDLKYGRTVHSLAKLTAQLGSNSQIFVSPDNLRMPRNLILQLQDKGVQTYETQSMDEILDYADIVYMTRVQREWFESEQEYQEAASMYRITQESMKKMRGDAVLMHPLPRVGEIDPEVDSDPRSAYFRQVNSGLYTRMALLSLIIPNDYVA